MSDDLVKAEAQAVRQLRHAVSRYAEQLREVLAQSRREVAMAERNAQDAVAQRVADVRRAEQELQAAQAALAGCQENCGGLARAVNAAQQLVARAKLQLEHARQAAQLLAVAQSDLLKVLQHVEASIGEHSSVASSALASLDAKLSQLPHFDLGAAVHGLVLGAGVAAGLATSTMDLSKLAGNVSQGAIPTDDQITSISQMNDTQTEQGQQQWREVETENVKRRDSGDGQDVTG